MSPDEPSDLVPGAREHYDDALYYDHTYRRRTKTQRYPAFHQGKGGALRGIYPHLC